MDTSSFKFLWFTLGLSILLFIAYLFRVFHENQKAQKQARKWKSLKVILAQSYVVQINAKQMIRMLVRMPPKIIELR